MNHDYYLLQRWMDSWKTFVNVDSLEQINNRDRITVCRVSSSDKSKSPVVMAAVCGSKQDENNKKHKLNERPAAISVVLLRKFTPKVPKGRIRRHLIKEGRIKTIYIPKKANHYLVHSKIKSAFGVDNFLVLDCYNGHRLSISTIKFVDGKLALQRRGCLYLCEINQESSLSSDDDDESESNTPVRQRVMPKDEPKDSDEDIDLPVAAGLFTGATSQGHDERDGDNDVIIIEETSSATHNLSQSSQCIPSFSDSGPSCSFSRGHNQNNIDGRNSASTSAQATTAVTDNMPTGSNSLAGLDQLVSIFQGKINRNQIEAMLEFCQSFDDTLECLLSGPNLDNILGLMYKVSMTHPIMKVDIEKDDAWSDLVSIYKAPNMNISSCQIRVRLINQPAIDIGGVRCQMYTMILQQFRDNKMCQLFDGEQNHLRPKYSALAMSSGMFKVLGSIIGHSIVQDGIGFPYLSPLCYWYIVAGEESALEHLTLSDVGADCCDFINQLDKASTNEEITVVCMNENAVDLLDRVGVSNVVNMDNKTVVAQSVMQHEGLYKLSILLDQLKEGLRRAKLVSLMENYPKEFAPLFTFCDDITAADVLEALNAVGDKDDTAMHYLHEYIKNLSKKELQEFMICITGSVLVKKCGILVSFHDNDVHGVISIHTCTNEISLPRGTFEGNYPIFKIAMDAAVGGHDRLCYNTL